MKCKNRPTFLRHLFVCVLVLGLNPLGVFAAEYFVSTTGNDSNPGTIGNPFRTLEKAASVMVAGDTMYIRGGTYQRTAWDLNVPSGGGTWAAATTIKAYNKEQVILTPQNPSQNGTDVIRLASNRSYIIFDGLILDGLRDGLQNGGRMAFRFQSNTHHIRIINTEMRNTFTNIIYTLDASHNEFINLNLHHGGSNDPNNTFQAYAIYMSGENNLVMGCDIHHNMGFGITNYSGHAFKPHNNVYIGNRFYKNERSGLQVGPGNGVKIINNLFYANGDNTGPRSYTGFNRYGIHIDLQGVQDVLIYNNTSYGNGKGELFLGGNAHNAVVKNNIFSGTNSNDYTVNIASGHSGSIVTNNLIYHPNASLLVLNQGTVTVSDNILSQNPLFLDTENSVFQLKPESPAIGKGVLLNEVKVDFDQVQRRLPYDIGAYAFLGSLLGAPKNLIVISEK